MNLVSGDNDEIKITVRNSDFNPYEVSITSSTTKRGLLRRFLKKVKEVTEVDHGSNKKYSAETLNPAWGIYLGGATLEGGWDEPIEVSEDSGSYVFRKL